MFELTVRVVYVRRFDDTLTDEISSPKLFDNYPSDEAIEKYILHCANYLKD